MRPDKVETSARTRAIIQDDGTSVLALTLFLHNKSRKRYKFSVSAIAELSVRMISAETPGSSHLFGPYGILLGKWIDLQPGKVEVLNWSIQISDLHQSGITPGRYRVFVQPTNSRIDAPQVAAGEVEVPEYTDLPE